MTHFSLFVGRGVELIKEKNDGGFRCWWQGHLGLRGSAKRKCGNWLSSYTVKAANLNLVPVFEDMEVILGKSVHVVSVPIFYYYRHRYQFRTGVKRRGACLRICPPDGQFA